MPANQFLFRRPAGLADGLARKEPALPRKAPGIRPKQLVGPPPRVPHSGSACSETYTTGTKDALRRPATQVAPLRVGLRWASKRPFVRPRTNVPPARGPHARCADRRRQQVDAVACAP